MSTNTTFRFRRSFERTLLIRGNDHVAPCCEFQHLLVRREQLNLSHCVRRWDFLYLFRYLFWQVYLVLFEIQQDEWNLKTRKLVDCRLGGVKMKLCLTTQQRNKFEIEVQVVQTTASWFSLNGFPFFVCALFKALRSGGGELKYSTKQCFIHSNAGFPFVTWLVREKNKTYFLELVKCGENSSIATSWS